MFKLPVALLISIALVGCASVPMDDPKLDATAKTFQAPPADKAGIYIYRNEAIGGSIKMAVFVDGKSIGDTAAKTYFYKELAPGKHTVESKSENSDLIEVDLKPGTLAFVWQEVKMGVMYARTKLHLVGEQEGKKGVQESKLAVIRW
jgi:hypothetical protein